MTLDGFSEHGHSFENRTEVRAGGGFGRRFDSTVSPEWATSWTSTVFSGPGCHVVEVEGMMVKEVTWRYNARKRCWVSGDGRRVDDCQIEDALHPWAAGLLFQVLKEPQPVPTS